MTHDREAAKAKELETRARLGRRLPKSPPAKHRPTAPTKTPRATGAPGSVIKDTPDNR